MSRWSVALLSTVLLPAGILSAQNAQPAAAPQWELREDGRWQQVNAPTTAPVGDETLDRVEEMLQGGQAQPAKKLSLAWIRSHKDSPIRDRGVFLLAQANYLLGNRIDSYYNFEEVLDLYPNSRYYYPSLERQFEIADQFLRGYKRRFLGLAILSARTEATEMLYRIQQRAPGSPLAERALLRVADYYYASAQFDLAADAYAAYYRSYPRSPLVPRVRLRQAFSSLAQFRGIRFDATPIIEARQQLTDLMQAYPRVAEEENLPAIVSRVDAALAKKLYYTADFYRRTDRPEASAYYLKYVMQTYPGSPEALAAPERLEALPDRAVEQARPPGEMPQTQPSRPQGNGGGR